MTLYRAKSIAIDEIEGKHKEQFGKTKAVFALLISNSGSHPIVDVDPIPGDENAVVFKAIFITFQAMVKGLLKGCRPIIRIHGCHFMSTVGGCLLSAVAKDG